MDNTGIEGPRNIQVFALAGPTASGKTEIALEAARQLPIEIINLDAMQVYREMDIGTAKPSASERNQAPHHLFDIADPREKIGAGNYVALATNAVKDILARKKIPLFVGGTGFYLRVMRQGLSPIPEISPEVRSSLRRELSEKGLPKLREQLLEHDPDWAAQIHPNDTQRTLRGLEVFRGTGKRLSEFHKEPRSGALPFYIQVFVLEPSKEELARRIAARVPRMIEAGLIEEVQSLLESGLQADCHAMGAPGYREICQFIRGELPRTELEDAITRSHRAYAKRQRTFLGTEEGTLSIPNAEALIEEIKKAASG